MASRLQELGDIEDALWSELESSVAPRAGGVAQHEWRVAVLATPDDDSAQALLVLREVDARERQLVFYIDARSPEVHRISHAPQGTLIVRSPALGWQMRMQVLLAVETSGLAVSSRWARLQTAAGAADYRSARAPGSVLDAPLADLGTRSHFAMITALVASIDWLELAPEGPRRALFGAGGPQWLQP